MTENADAVADIDRTKNRILHGFFVGQAITAVAIIALLLAFVNRSNQIAGSVRSESRRSAILNCNAITATTTDFNSIFSLLEADSQTAYERAVAAHDSTLAATAKANLDETIVFANRVTALLPHPDCKALPQP